MMKAVRNMITVVLVGIGLGAALVLAGCDEEAVAEAASARGLGSVAMETPAPAQPEPASEREVDGAAEGELTLLAMAIDELLQQAEVYEGQEVVVQGTILTQCITGCMFSLDDGTGVIGIELVEEGLENVLMTGSVGRIVEVRGVVEGSKRPLILVKDRAGWRYVD